MICFGFLRRLRYCWRKVIGILIPFLLVPLLMNSGTKETKCAYAVLWVAGYFVFEPIPSPATALLPILLFPMLGIMGTNDTCKLYFKDIIVMFMAALIMSSAIEHCNLHKRIALSVLMILGTSVRRLMIGFILVSMFLSMWLINTATTAMMAPIVDALIEELQTENEDSILNAAQARNDNGIAECGLHQLKIENERTQKDQKISNSKQHYNRLRKALLLSVAYSSTCGGTGSVIGTGPNFVLVALMEELYPKTNQLTFTNWLIFNVPGMILCCICVFIVVQTFYVGCSFNSSKEEERKIKDILKKKHAEMGPIRFHEFTILFIFLSLLITWMFRKPRFMEGWASKLGSDVNITNATPGIAACLLLFMIPLNPKELASSKPLLDWKTAERKTPWGILLLFGSGLAIAEGVERSGLSIWIVEQLKQLSDLSPNLILLILCLLTAMVTEVLTNMTAATLLLPVVNQMAIAVGIHPLFLMLPVTICCSFSFMLPVGNPPCAIVYQAGNMETSDLMKPGIFLNIICCLIEVMMINTLGKVVFDFDVNHVPEYLNATRTANFANITNDH